ncbi:putative bifunctional diguanylate cyclase/phosphodiesterase [Pseudohongiella sp.]|uniref:Diguanylate cyclase/phosphodiesterase with PAS/PAC sensor(S) n=1 Tax=marine sediment metagenome TaxID=412755 RepID=A0A0F9Z1I1_9ZZZZ|nr:GGDEF domain-containing phosphodiesterase [Pseudohongiella sp.]HDZ08274.1 EAL domain-containing protein [Pseudohongiella sp.]HEA62550.1 EAL domain-containing protein [Pseudohongiella sp.]
MAIDQVRTLSEQLIESERRRIETQRLSGVGFWELNHKAESLYWSEEIFAIYALDPNTVEPNYETFVSLIYEDDKELVDTSYRESVKTGEEYNIRYRVITGDSYKWIEARGITYYDVEGNPERSIGTAQDISEIIDGQQEIEFLATHDALTRLPNRNLLSDRIRMALRLAQRKNSTLLIMFIDLDNFKLINDTHGHDVGDEVLQGLAKQFDKISRAGDTFARIGGDEFVGLISVEHESNVDRTVRRIKKSIERNYETRVRSFFVTASIGVAIYPNDSEDAESLIRHADHAMYEAKQLGKSAICYFDRQKHHSIVSKNHLLKEIQHAIQNDAFEIYYQPKVSLLDGSLEGAEALLRWFRPEGSISPAEVIKAISGSSLEWELDRWVIKKVLADKCCFDQLNRSLTVSFNVIPSTIENPAFPEYISELLRHSDAIPDGLEVEILEVSSINNFEHIEKVLDGCKALGLSLSLDDFGTGYSSLSYFHSLPIDKVKIDGSFISKLNTDDSSLVLIKSILAMAKANGCNVTAEGIESDAIAKTLSGLGCDNGQGFSISRPIPINDYIDLVRNWDANSYMKRLNGT